MFLTAYTINKAGSKYFSLTLTYKKSSKPENLAISTHLAFGMKEQAGCDKKMYSELVPYFDMHK